jgi:hypothetical protein
MGPRAAAKPLVADLAGHSLEHRLLQRAPLHVLLEIEKPLLWGQLLAQYVLLLGLLGPAAAIKANNVPAERKIVDSTRCTCCHTRETSPPAQASGHMQEEVHFRMDTMNGGASLHCAALHCTATTGARARTCASASSEA